MLPAAGDCSGLLLIVEHAICSSYFLCPATAPYLVLDPLLVAKQRIRKGPGGQGQGEGPGGTEKPRAQGGRGRKKDQEKGGGGGRPKGAGTRALALWDDPAVIAVGTGS